MKVCIVGLGAIGGLVTARLARHTPPGLELRALARGATLAAVRAEGLVLEDADGMQHLPLEVHDDPGALGEHDLVVVAVKAPALAAVAPAVARLAGANGSVLSAMNGVPWWFFDGLPADAPEASVPLRGASLASVDPAGELRARLPPARTVGAVVHLAASSPAPGRVRHAQGLRWVMGAATGGVGPRTEAAAALFAAAGFEVEAVPCVQRELWFKLWGNMTMNPVSALTGATVDRILDDELVRGFVSGVMTEAQSLGAALGLPIVQSPEQRHAVTRQLGAIRTSMLQDLEAGRPLEIDALLAAVREIGQRLGQPTPLLDALLGLTRLMARGRGLYPG
jgi:2-dehydropantoate 2-reductase